MPYKKETLEKLKQNSEWVERQRLIHLKNQKLYAQRHPDRIKALNHKRVLNGKNREYCKQWRDEHIEHSRQRSRSYYHKQMQDPKNRDKVRKRVAQYIRNRRKQDPKFAEALRKQARKQYYANLEKSREQSRLRKIKSRYANLEKSRKYGQVWNVKYRSVPQNKLRHRFSNMILKRLRNRLGGKDNKSTFDFLPYTLEQLMRHLESKFKSGMSWDNYGKWHIDHVTPDSYFKYNKVTDSEFQRSWALENLQPLWAKDNLAKGGYRRNKIGGLI